MPPSAIMVLGIHGRSGTNHLYDLLRTHPSVGAVPGLWEDHLVQHLGELEAVRTGLQARWRHQPIGGDGADALALLLGDAVLTFLRSCVRDGIPLIKTPSPVGLDLAHTFLPSARVIVIVRDARDVAESCVKTFGSTKQRWLRAWRAGARVILRAMEQPTATNEMLLVRYEDLVADRHGVLIDICQFLGLPPMTSSPEELDRIPVRGSSSLAGPRVHWKPVDMGEGFRPVGRYRSWSNWELRQADALVGSELEAFGYERRWASTSLDPALRSLLKGPNLVVGGAESVRFRLARWQRRSRAALK